LYSILSEFVISSKLGQPIKIINLFQSYVVHETRRCSIPCPFNFTFKCVRRKISENQVGLELKGMHPLLVHAVLTYWAYTLTPQRETEAVLDSGKEIGLF
jgi:hypothetical protein